MKQIMMILMVLSVGLMASAQSRREVMRERVDSVLRKNYEKGSYDTLYMKRPDSRLTLKLRANLSGYYQHSTFTENGIHYNAKVNTDTRGTLSAAATYYGVTAGLSLNPARLAGKNKDMEFNINAYGNRFGVEASYQDSKTLSGDINYNNGSFHINKGDVKLTLVNVTGYYAFNYRHFSYPAAFTQSYIQKRSAGSWLLGATYQGGRIKATDDAPATMSQSRTTMNTFAVGGGYGYNLVAGKWLFHGSAQPSLILFNDIDIKENGVSRDGKTYFPELITNTRVAIIYNFSRKYFVGSTFLFNTTLLGDNDDYTRQTKWRARAFFGFRL
ncbi:MAG: DUF4421 family protein [Bacteroidaceae bacterium]|nr:DUF4421 family protein [Bacteroidaceae bacterium]